MKPLIHHFRRVLSDPSYWFAIAIGTLCVVLHVGEMSEVLRYDRQNIDSGAWWLLLTGNIVHLGNSHLLMNIAGFALVVMLVWSHFSWLEWLLVSVISSAAVGIGLYILDTDVNYYVGFSGTLHGLIIAGCLADFRSYPKSAALLLVMIIAKLGWEQVSGALPGSEAVAGGDVLVNAHLYGAVGGAVVGAVLLLWKWLRHKPALSVDNSG